VSSRSLSIEERERLRAQKEAAAKAVNLHGAAMGVLVAAPERRAELIAIQDELVSKAESGVADRAVGVIEVSGLDRTGLILGVSKMPLRRYLAVARQRTERMAP